MRSIYDASVMYVHVRPAYEFRRGFCTLVLSFLLQLVVMAVRKCIADVFVILLSLWIYYDSKGAGFLDL